MTGVIGLLALALLPAIVLCIYVYRKDRVEKEPLGLLLKLLFFGALSCGPVVAFEVLFGGILDLFFPPGYVISIAAHHFIGVALVEESFKFIVLIWLTRKNKEYNSFFDGMIYAIFVSLGFAALENVMYVFNNGVAVGIMRAVMSVPGHMFFAVLMGYHYSLWHLTEKSAEIEEQLKSQGLIRNDLPPFSAQKDKALSLIMPIAAHGFYNTCCSVGTGLSMVVLFAFLIFMYIHCFKKIKKMSLSDGFENKYAGYLINKKYPGARIVVQEENYTVV